MKKHALILLLLTLIVATFNNTAGAVPTEMVDPVSGLSSVVDKFSLWQKPAFFRGAMLNPATNYLGRPGLGPTVDITKADLVALKAAGANVVTLLYSGLYDVTAPYEWNMTNHTRLESAINWAWETGLYVVINIGSGPGRPEDSAFNVDTKDETVWYSEMEQGLWVDMWKDIATLYKDHPNVIGYDLFGEPHPEAPISQPPALPAVWYDLAKRITAAIRVIDKDTPIIVESTNYAGAGAFKSFVPTGDARTIYSFHMYEPESFTSQGLVENGTPIVYAYPGSALSDDGTVEYWDKTRMATALAPVKDFQVKNPGAPIFVGEFGCNRKILSCINYLGDAISLFEANGWHHTYFAWHVDDEFDYEKEPTETVRVPESSYMKMIKTYWAKNVYF